MKIKRLLFGILPLALSFTLFSCGSNNNESVEEQNGVEQQKQELFELAKASGFSGTYEQWLASIKGDAIEIKFDNGFIMWKYKLDDEYNWRNLINLSEYLGTDSNIASLKDSIANTNTLIDTLNNELKGTIASEDAKLKTKLDELETKYDASSKQCLDAINANKENLEKLETEYEEKLAELKTSYYATLALLDETHNASILELDSKYEEEVKKLQEANKANEEALASLASKHEENLTKLSEELDKKIEDTTDEYNKSLADFKDTYDAEVEALEDALENEKTKLTTLEEKHNTDVEKLQKAHNEAVDNLTKLINDTKETIEKSLDETAKKVATNETSIESLQLGLNDVNRLLNTFKEQCEKDKEELRATLDEKEKAIIDKAIADKEELLSVIENLEDTIKGLDERIKELETIPTYKVTFIKDNGEEDIVIEVEKLSTVKMPDMPLKDGFTFVGWYDSHDEMWKFNKDIVFEDIQLTAKYDIIEYTISYNLNGGSGVEKQKYTANDSFYLYIPTRDGYTFEGWYTESSFINSIEKIEYQTDDISLFAKWNELKFEVPKDYDATSRKIYNTVYGSFYENVQKADTAESIALRYAYQGIAEAKLLETGTLVPGTASGGNYAVSKVAPYTITPVNWGSDNYRYHNAVITTEPLKSEDRDALKALYGQLKGTGTYEASVKAYLTTHGYTLKDTYNLAYSSDPTVYDILNSFYAVDSQPLLNTYDGLLEYDGEGELKPALATGYEVSEDGKTYTFTIRSGAQWVDKDGNRLADVQADDFVAGFQHMLDCQGGLVWLVDGLVEGAHEYLEEKETDFAKVGVKAEGNKVIYSLTDDTPYFTTMLGYSIFAPMCRPYYESQGGKFGGEFDASAESYHYAKDYSHIAYCGPYLLKQYTKENTFVFRANPTYWNKNNINIKTITWLFNDGSDSTKAYNDFRAGTIDSASLNTAVMPTAKENGDFENYGFITTPDAYSYPYFININRYAYTNSNDITKLVSPKSAEEKELAYKALLNQNVRLALCMSFDKKTYYSISKGEDVALNAVTNSWTPATFVSMPEDVTVKINDVDKTYKKGTYIGQVMQDQLDADGLGAIIKVFDPKADGGAGSGYGFDGWYHPTEAKSYLARGVEELKAQGVTVDKDHPVVLDFPTYENYIAKAQANAYKQSIESATDGLIKINVIVAEVRSDQLWGVYYPDNGYEMNYDISTTSGWGPDYGDPKNYQDCFLPQGGGMVKCVGIY